MTVNSLKTTTAFKVRFRECDPLQIVWHGNYLKYFEDAREDFCSRHGFSYHEVMELGYATPIVRSQCEHKLPLLYGDHFKVETTYIPTAAAKIVFRYEIICAEKTVCTGETVQVFLNKKGELVYNFPPFFLDWKKKMGL